MVPDMKTHIAVSILNKLLELEEMKGSGDPMKDIKEDACNTADVVYIYTEAIMRKFEPPRGVTMRESPPVGSEIKIPSGELTHFDN